MLQQEAYNQLLDLIYTKLDADDFAEQLNIVIDQLYKKDIQPDIIIKEIVPSDKSRLIISYLSANRIDSNDRVRVQSLLQDIKDAILSIPIVQIVLPFEPKEKHLKLLSAWFQVNCRLKVLLQITVDTSLIGGAAIGFKGVYKEYTVHKLIEEAFREGKFANLLHDKNAS